MKVKYHHFILICALAIHSRPVFTQDLDLTIDTLKVFSIINQAVNGEVILHDNGPSIKLLASFSNNSDTIITLNPSKASYHVSFNLDGKNFKKELFPLAFTDIDQIVVLPGGSEKFVASENLFSGTSIYSVSKKDYSDELIKALPTIRIVYIQSDFSVTSSAIKTVRIHER